MKRDSRIGISRSLGLEDGVESISTCTMDASKLATVANVNRAGFRLERV